jgi:RNA polymerase sigma-70 factor (ECF subfamily)
MRSYGFSHSLENLSTYLQIVCAAVNSRAGITQVRVETLRPALARKETVRIAPPDPSATHHRREVERWFLELRDPVFRYLRSLGCRHSLAEEIAQEAFLRLHRGLREGLQVSDVRAWVFRVARNLWIDSRREHQRYHTAGQDNVDHLDEEHTDSAADPEQQALHQERIRRIAEEVLRLPELQRECMHLKAQGLRYHEIAATLGISMTAAVDSVRRAVKRLGRLFKD